MLRRAATRFTTGIRGAKEVFVTRAAPACRPLDPVVGVVDAVVHKGRTDEALNAQFGISYNTWRKIETDHLIRASVVERLERRVGREPSA